MAITIKKSERVPETKSIKSLALIKFFLALAGGSIITIWAIYINSFVNNVSTTGIISSALTLVAFISFFLFVPLIERSDKGKLFFYTLVLTTLSYFLFLYIESFLLFILLAITITILQTIRVSTLGVIVKDKSSNKALSKNEGLLFTFVNLGYLVGPLLGGYIAAKYQLTSVFIIAIIASLIAMFIFKFNAVKDSRTTKPHDNVFKNFLDFFKKKDRVMSYLLTGGTSSWWILIYLFMPLFILEQGLNEKYIGYFLFAITVPLILTEYIFSTLSNKYGYKKIFKFGFIIPAILAFIAFFISNIYLLMGTLVIASFGLALLEPTSESYFLSRITKNQASKFYGPYYTTLTVSAFFGKMIASILIIYFPFKSLFLLFSGFMLIFFFISSKVKD
jgi:MFS transporter, ACDE family, multidrug resistance protein